jgi:L-threonylcarbamoyladenylate synthase
LKINCDQDGIEKTSQIIEKGGIAIFPTDTVYGIGCNPYNLNSVKKIYEIKSRAEIKSLPVLAYSLDIVKEITLIDKFTEKIIKKYWPGPLTLILTLTDQKLKKSLKLQNKIAVRIPNSKCTLKLLEKCKLLVGTSANVSGNSSYTNPDECIKNIKNYDVFLNGGTITSKGESTIIEIENEEIKIIREGVLKIEEIMI